MRITLILFATIFFLAGIFFAVPSNWSGGPIPEQKNEEKEIAKVLKETATTTSAGSSAPVKVIYQPKIVAPVVIPEAPPKTDIPYATTTLPATSLVPAAPAHPELPPLDEEAILASVVKIECPSADGLGKYVGSGFSVGNGKIITAAHVVKDSASETCRVIFPRERRPIYYLQATIEDLSEVKRRHDERGVDVAVLHLPAIETYPEARQIFSRYPAIPYPVCTAKDMLGDVLFHYGYPSNYVDQNYLSRLTGEAVVNAAIKGIKDQLSEDQTYSFKTPIFGFTYDETKLYPYMISRVASFYGDSGGLAFNAAKQCVIGPHRGGTIGKTSGENLSIFMNLGWVEEHGL